MGLTIKCAKKSLPMKNMGRYQYILLIYSGLSFLFWQPEFGPQTQRGIKCYQISIFFIQQIFEWGKFYPKRDIQIGVVAVVFFNQPMGAQHTICWSKSIVSALKQVFPSFSITNKFVHIKSKVGFEPGSSAATLLKR